MAFPEVVGHERLRDVLARAAARGHVPPALLFSGPDGVGKKTLALALGRRLLCERAPVGLAEVDGEPPEACGECRHCRRVAHAVAALPAARAEAAAGPDEATRLNHRLHPDLLLIEPWRTGIKIEQVRETVREVAGLPFEARVRVVILDDAHLMTEPAANSLLKSLEEPPPTSHLVLVSSAPQALLPTIRSRCQVLRFGRLPLALLAHHLQATCGLEAGEARLRAGLAAGSLGAALAFESGAYRALRDQLLDLLGALDASGVVERLEVSERLAEEDDPQLALATLRSLLRDVAVLRAGAGQALLNTDVAPRLEALARGPLGARAARLAEAVAETRAALRGNAYKSLALDVLLERLAGA
jgi:DNA polymerase-3 subunit delta'